MSVFSSMRYCLGEPTEYGAIWAALAFMPFGLFFDFMDGKIARWRKKSSLMGQELDSLADLVNEPGEELNHNPANSFASNRSPSASPPLPPLSPLVSEPRLITSSSHSSFFAALLAWPDST
jgi:hypothetical protein